MLQQQLSNEGGFTMIETVIALVVMMVVALGAASLFYIPSATALGPTRAPKLSPTRSR